MAAWQDYKDSSQLTLVFGKVSAKVDVLGRSLGGVENHSGIILHPYEVAELLPGSGDGGQDYTRTLAKALAQSLLELVLAEATRELPPASKGEQNAT